MVTLPINSMITGLIAIYEIGFVECLYNYDILPFDSQWENRVFRSIVSQVQFYNWRLWGHLGLK